MLTRDRGAMAMQAVRSFREQTYDPAKRLLVILDTGDPAWSVPGSDAENEAHLHAPQHVRKTIGELRNIAHLVADCDIIVTWDSDDVSNPDRIAEQVALLQSSGADCVGYNEMLFWREPDSQHRGQAWLYRNPNPHYALGTSLCYWRRTWEAKPFAATSHGEDLQFCAGLKVAAVWTVPSFADRDPATGIQDSPRMIARIHPGNTSTAYHPDVMEREARKKNPMWKRVVAWDEYCGDTMAC